MDIADVFAVNKSDRDGAAAMVKNIQMAMHERASGHTTQVVKTNAATGDGTGQLFQAIKDRLQVASPAKRTALLAEHAYTLIMHCRMKDVGKTELLDRISKQSLKDGFNIYSFIREYC